MSKPILIPKIARRPLPQLPSPEAVKAFGRNEHSYHPDMWELEYATRRYLERTDDAELVLRYSQILRNVRSLAGPEWDTLPIDIPRGSWYWLRKEYLTRLEFALRGQDIPEGDLSAAAPDREATRPDVPVAGLLFRFGKREHMQELVEGRVRFTPAKAYEGDELNEARKDEEKAKHAFSPGQYVTVTQHDGSTIPIIGNLKRTVHGGDYHMACFSREWDGGFFDAFDADACVVVKDPDQFVRRIEAAGQAVFPGWYFMHCGVEYYDPHELPPKQVFSPPISKDFSFAYQREYRVFWDRLGGTPVEGIQYIDIGSARDILSIYGKDGKAF